MAVDILQSLAQGTAGNMTGADVANAVNNLITNTGINGKSDSVVFNADSDGLGGGTDDASNLTAAFDALNDGEVTVRVVNNSGATQDLSSVGVHLLINKV